MAKWVFDGAPKGRVASGDAPRPLQPLPVLHLSTVNRRSVVRENTTPSPQHHMAAYTLPEMNPKLTEPDADIPSVHEAKAEARVAKAALKRAKADARVAAQRAKLAKVEHKLELQAEREGRTQQDLELARRGYKRTRFLGRIVPVRGSRRARAHTRRV